MPLPALGELPQLTELSLAWRRLVDLKPVLMLVNNTGLVCCWEQRGRWQQRVVGWPEGVCRDGVPLQREAVGELIRQANLVKRQSVGLMQMKDLLLLVSRLRRILRLLLGRTVLLTVVSQKKVLLALRLGQESRRSTIMDL